MMNTPLVVKAKKALIDTKVAILGVTARVRVRAVEAGKAAAKYPTECYIKIKDGFIYVQGRVGETILSIKVSLAELAKSANAKVLALRAEVEKQLIAYTKLA